MRSGYIPRRNYFIKKKFQRDVSLYFLVLLILQAFLIAVLFLFLSKGTLTAAYIQEGLRIENTASFFFVNFILISLIVGVMVALVAMVVFIYLSHRLAGPLYRFERSLNEVSGGNLCYRIRLRKTDQLEELQNALNSFIENIDNSIGDIKQEISAVSKMLKQEKIDRDKLEEAFEKLKDKLGFFKTSK